MAEQPNSQTEPEQDSPQDQPRDAGAPAAQDTPSNAPPAGYVMNYQGRWLTQDQADALIGEGVKALNTPAPEPEPEPEPKTEEDRIARAEKIAQQAQERAEKLERTIQSRDHREQFDKRFEKAVKGNELVEKLGPEYKEKLREHVLAGVVIDPNIPLEQRVTENLDYQEKLLKKANANYLKGKAKATADTKGETADTADAVVEEVEKVTADSIRKGSGRKALASLRRKYTGA